MPSANDQQIPPLPAHAGATLLPLARASIASHFGSVVSPPSAEDWLRRIGACFVTLIYEDKLRGCIGTLEAHRSLVDDVRANASAAAFRDPRFQPLTVHELDITRIEISALSVIEPIVFRSEDEALAQLRPGTDGVIFEYGCHRSTFLPQVWEDFRSPHRFIGNLKYKAGLPPDFWDPSVKLSRYTVNKWVEHDHS